MISQLSAAIKCYNTLNPHWAWLIDVTKPELTYGTGGMYEDLPQYSNAHNSSRFFTIGPKMGEVGFQKLM